MITALPSPTPVTTPFLTVTTESSELDHVTLRSLSVHGLALSLIHIYGGCIREGGELILRNGLGLGEAIEHRSDLLTGNGCLGSKLVGADALDDTGFRRPLDGVGIPDALGDILERIDGVLHIRLAGHRCV